MRELEDESLKHATHCVAEDSVYAEWRTVQIHVDRRTQDLP